MLDRVNHTKYYLCYALFVNAIPQPVKFIFYLMSISHVLNYIWFQIEKTEYDREISDLLN